MLCFSIRHTQVRDRALRVRFELGAEPLQVGPAFTLDGAKSHGSKTVEGKQIASLNAAKDGLTADIVVL